ncbi:MAG TPA: SH3 domain-containing protein [Feifaniaceae bacterium]|nr:SH3 domain-containing protein [Feifaniaceae bacterium]
MTNNEFDFVVDTGLKWARSLTRLKKLDTIVIHHSASDHSTINSIHAHHKSEGHAGCDYNYVITPDGVIYKGRGLIYEGGHVGNAKSNNLNEHSCGICITGAIHKHKPSAAQVASAKKLISAILAQNGQSAGGVPIRVATLYGHREVPYYVNKKLTGRPYPTLCPGEYMPLSEFKALLTNEPEVPDEPAGKLPAYFAYGGDTKVNVRRGPSTGHEIIGSLSAGEQCIVLSASDGWANIVLHNQDPIVAGYCIDTYLTEKDESDPPAFYTYQGGSYVHLRSGPGTGYRKIGTVSAKDRVLVLDLKNGWAEVVKYNDTPALRGWCVDTYLRRT